MAETARVMDTSRHTVRKVRDLFLVGGWEALKDGREGPDRPANKIHPAWEYQILSDYLQEPIKTVTSFADWFNRVYGTTFSVDVFYRVTARARDKKRQNPNIFCLYL